MCPSGTRWRLRNCAQTDPKLGPKAPKQTAAFSLSATSPFRPFDRAIVLDSVPMNRITPRTLLAALLSMVFLALAMVHLYWALGGQSGRLAAVVHPFTACHSAGRAGARRCGRDSRRSRRVDSRPCVHASLSRADVRDVARVPPQGGRRLPIRRLFQVAARSKR